MVKKDTPMMMRILKLKNNFFIVETLEKYCK